MARPAPTRSLSARGLSQLFGWFAAALLIGYPLGEGLFLLWTHLGEATFVRYAPVIAAIASAVAASAAAWNARNTAHSGRATLLRQLADQYGAEDLGRAVRLVHEWYRGQKSSGVDPVAVYVTRYALEAEDIDKVHWARRRVSRYYMNIWALAEQGLLDTNLLDVLVTPDQADFFLTVIRPMDVAIQTRFGRDPDARVEHFYRDYLNRRDRKD